MERFYNSLRPGDLIYVRVVVSMEGRLGLCRIIEIKRYESRPDYIEFNCEIVQQWFPDYGPIRWFGKRLTVGCNIDFAYPGMWHVYSVEEFESTHDAVRESRIAREELQKRWENTRHKMVKGVIALVAILLVLYVLISVMESVL